MHMLILVIRLIAEFLKLVRELRNLREQFLRLRKRDDKTAKARKPLKEKNSQE